MTDQRSFLYKTHYFEQRTEHYTYKKRLLSTKKLSICITALSMYFLRTLSDLFRRSVKWRSRYAFQCHCILPMQVQQTCGRGCIPALLKEIRSTWLLSRRIVKFLLQFWLFSCHEQNQVPGIWTQFMKIYERCRMSVLEIFVTCHTDGRQ